VDLRVVSAEVLKHTNAVPLAAGYCPMTGHGTANGDVRYQDFLARLEYCFFQFKLRIYFHFVPKNACPALTCPAKKPLLGE
jgi:hypothetical protein